MLLFVAAAIWGLAFVAQRVGSEYLGAFTFNGIRFALGSISLIPLIFYFNKKNRKDKDHEKKTDSKILTIKGGVIIGCVLFLAASIQQIGLSYTTAGKAGFITGFYIVLVPVFSIILKQRIDISVWGGAVLAILGLYFLSGTENFAISKGDLYELVGAVFWAFHILLIDHFTNKVDAIKLSFIQFVTCSVLSMIVALIFERVSIYGLTQALVPLLYGGICSVGIAYTLQVIGQKHAKASHSAIILSLESVFACIGGILILNEPMGFRGFIGCVLMFSGMILSQFKNLKKL